MKEIKSFYVDIQKFEARLTTRVDVGIQII